MSDSLCVLSTLSKEERELAAAALSSYAMAPRSAATDRSGNLADMLSAWARTPLTVGNVDYPAPDPACPVRGFPRAQTALRRLGIDWSDAKAIWEEAKDRRGVTAALPDRVLLEFVPATLWPSVVALIREGPAIAWQRQERALIIMAKAPMRKRRPSAKPGQPLARTTLRVRSEAIRGLMRELVKMQKLEYPSDLLAGWTGVPDAGPVPGREPLRGGRVPSRRALRLAWQRTISRIEDRFGPIETAASVISSMTPAKLRGGGHRDLRLAAILILLAVVGARRGAVTRLERGDYRRTSDGRRHIALRPAKSLDPEEGRLKALPAGAEAIFDALIAFVDGRAGRALEADEPLLVGTIATLSPISPGTIVRAVARAIPLEVAQCDGEGTDGVAATHPHALRAAAAQLIRDGGRRYCEEHGIAVAPDVIADVLLDHDIPTDRFGYLGISTPSGRERFSDVGAAIAWRMLTTDEGAEKVVDAEALRGASRARGTLSSQAARARTRERELREEVGARRAAAGRSPDAVSLLAILGKYLELQTVWEEERRLREEVARLDLEIESLRSDPKRRIALPDDAVPRPSEIDPEAILLEEEGTVEVNGRRAKLIRDWLTVAEFAAWAETSEPTARRWVSGACLPYREGDPRNPWQRNAIPLVVLSPRRRIIKIAGISEGFIAQGDRGSRLESLLTRQPSGWVLDSPDGIPGGTAVPKERRNRKRERLDALGAPGA